MIRRSQTIALLVSCLSLVWLCPARHGVANEALAEGIDAVVNRPAFKHAWWGLLVVDRATGEVLHALNPDKLFAPASTTKLFSVASALNTFGADYQFQTPVFVRGTVDGDGRLDGELILVASGDLTMGGRTLDDGQIAFSNSDHTYAESGSTGVLTDPDPLAGLHHLAQQVAAAGIRHVAGDVLIDERLFESASSTGSGPARLSPIMINDNVVDFTMTPASVGQAATVRWRPESIMVQVDARVDTIEAGGETRVSAQRVGDGTYVVRGQIAADHQPLVRISEVADPAAFARGLFIEALNRAGVGVDASPLENGATVTAQEYDALTQVAVLTSPRFAESMRLILKVSHNLHASTLPLLVAARHGERSLSDGLRRQREFLLSAGIDADAISFNGAAGGGRADYVTPRVTVDLLRYLAGRDDFEEFERALPILGVDGTLAGVVDEDSPARGKVRAKTGTLFWYNAMNSNHLLTSKALAGYAETASGRPLAFAIFVNNVHLSDAFGTVEMGRVLGELCEIIYSSAE